MLDRTFFVLLIMCVLSAAVTYDRYLQAKGEVSPVSRLIDFVGLARFNEEEQENTRTIRKQYQAGIKNDLKRLQEKHEAIEKKRAELVRARGDVLNQLQDVNAKVRAEAEKYMAIIHEERQRIVRDIPEIRELCETLGGPVTGRPSDMKYEDYLLAKKEFVKRLEEVVEDPYEDFPTLSEIFELAEERFSQEAASQETSGRACGSPEECWTLKREALFEELQAKLDLYETGGQSRLEKILSSSEVLQREYVVLSENFEASDQFYADSNDKIEEGFQELAEQLVEVTEDKFRDLMRLYQELWEEYQEIETSIDLNYERLSSAHRNLDSQVQEQMPHLKKNWLVEMGSFETFYQDSVQRRAQLEEKLQVNKVEIVEWSRHSWMENKAFINGVAQAIDFEEELEHLMQQREYAEKMNEGKSGAISSRSMRESSESSRDAKMQVHLDNRRKQKRFVQDQMKKMREKARDYGYFD